MSLMWTFLLSLVAVNAKKLLVREQQAVKIIVNADGHTWQPEIGVDGIGKKNISALRALIAVKEEEPNHLEDDHVMEQPYSHDDDNLAGSDMIGQAETMRHELYETDTGEANGNGEVEMLGSLLARRQRQHDESATSSLEGATAPKVETDDNCIADFNSDHPCCNQQYPTSMADARYGSNRCPSDRPICAGYVYTNTYGTCYTAPTAKPTPAPTQAPSPKPNPAPKPAPSPKPDSGGVNYATRATAIYNWFTHGRNGAAFSPVSSGTCATVGKLQVKDASTCETAKSWGPTLEFESGSYVDYPPGCIAYSSGLAVLWNTGGGGECGFDNWDCICQEEDCAAASDCAQGFLCVHGLCTADDALDWTSWVRR